MFCERTRVGRQSKRELFLRGESGAGTEAKKGREEQVQVGEEEVERREREKKFKFGHRVRSFPPATPASDPWLLLHSLLLLLLSLFPSFLSLLSLTHNTSPVYLRKMSSSDLFRRREKSDQRLIMMMLLLLFSFLEASV